MSLLLIGIALGIVNAAATQFETMTFAGLILPYAVISMDRNQRDVASLQVHLTDGVRYVRLLELLKNPERKTKRDVEWEFAQAQHEFKKERRKVSIYSYGWVVVALLAVYQILRILLPLTPFGSRF